MILEKMQNGILFVIIRARILDLLLNKKGLSTSNIHHA